MTTLEPALLQAIALAFRRRFETVDLSKAPGALPHFPEGCCHWASYMIGHFLKYEHRLEPLEVIGQRFAPDGTDGHSWLTLDHMIIDITSDEFPDSNKAVIVSDSSEWHKGWRAVETNSILRIQSYDAPHLGLSMLPSDVYELLVAEARML